MANELSQYIVEQWKQPEKRYPFFVSSALSALCILYFNLTFFPTLVVLASAVALTAAAVPVVKYIIDVANKFYEALEHLDEAIVKSQTTLDLEAFKTQLTQATKESTEVIAEVKSKTLPEINDLAKELKETLADVKTKTLPEVNGTAKELKETIAEVKTTVIPQATNIVKEKADMLGELVEDAVEEAQDLLEEVVEQVQDEAQHLINDVGATVEAVNLQTLPKVNHLVDNLSTATSAVSGPVSMIQAGYQRVMGKKSNQQQPQAAEQQAQMQAPQDVRHNEATEQAQLRQAQREARKNQRQQNRVNRKNKSTATEVSVDQVEMSSTPVLSTQASEQESVEEQAPQVRQSKQKPRRIQKHKPVQVEDLVDKLAQALLQSGVQEEPRSVEQSTTHVQSKEQDVVSTQEHSEKQQEAPAEVSVEKEPLPQQEAQKPARGNKQRAKRINIAKETPVEQNIAPEQQAPITPMQVQNKEVQPSLGELAGASNKETATSGHSKKNGFFSSWW